MRFLEKINAGDICAEVGVFKGEFSQYILKRKPSQLHLIDPWESITEMPLRCYAKPQEEMDKMYESVCKLFEKQNCVYLERGYSEPVSKKYDDCFFDWVYIDANHSYEYVKQDLALWYPKVKIGGWLCGDDYRKNDRMKWGVVEAVQEFVTEREMIEDLITVGNQYAIKVRGK